MAQTLAGTNVIGDFLYHFFTQCIPLPLGLLMLAREHQHLSL